jgi:hypothetical protein
MKRSRGVQAVCLCGSVIVAVCFIPRARACPINFSGEFVVHQTNDVSVTFRVRQDGSKVSGVAQAYDLTGTVHGTVRDQILDIVVEFRVETAHYLLKIKEDGTFGDGFVLNLARPASRSSVFSDDNFCR